jgi:uncharacterized membrane protein YgcG
MRHLSHHSPHSPARLIMGATAILGALYLLSGCAQRASLNPNFGVSYQSIFYQQASTPAIQLAPTTAEDAKRISESRSRRSGRASSGRASRFGFAGGGGGVLGN